ncbi:hypothetical protein ABTN46_19655, partial [Acinetobacter baumannii]
MTFPDPATGHTADPEPALMRDADARAAAYRASIGERRVYPDAASLAALAAFEEALPDHGHPAASTLDLLDRI